MRLCLCIALTFLGSLEPTTGSNHNNPSPIIKTTHGPVLGENVTTSSGDVYRYLGIPYARPPLADLRLKSPQEPQAWTDTADVTEYRPGCLQVNPFTSALEGAEDCLYLNVFAPADEEEESLAVMVWIHGGLSDSGRASQFPAETLAAEGGVVVVTADYRLGLFGFFTDGGGEYPGNAGILDQQMVLKWVQSDIAAFGGDPTKVTIFGEGLGSLGVSVHMVSPGSAGLFARAISQSGTLAGAFLDKDIDRAAGYHLALMTSHSCDADTFPACVRSLDGEVLARIPHEKPEYLGAYLVTVGNAALPEHPDRYWEDGKLNTDRYMLGVNEGDGAVLFSKTLGFQADPPADGLSAENDAFKMVAKRVVYLAAAGNEEIEEAMWTSIYNQYILDATDKEGTLRALLDLSRDSFLLAGTIRRATQLSRAGSAYLYYFKDSSPGPGDFTGKVPYLQELPYLFSFLQPAKNNTVEQRNLSRNMITSWTTYAKTGEPKLLTLGGQGVTWDPYDSTTQMYACFSTDADVLVTDSRLLPQAESFWNELIPAYREAQEEPEPESEGEPANGKIIVEDPCSGGASIISRNKAETALFMLILVLIVLLVAFVLLIMQYMGLKTKAAEDTKALSKPKAQTLALNGRPDSVTAEVRYEDVPRTWEGDRTQPEVVEIALGDEERTAMDGEVGDEDVPRTREGDRTQPEVVEIALGDEERTAMDGEVGDEDVPRTREGDRTQPEVVEIALGDEERTAMDGNKEAMAYSNDVGMEE